MNHNNDDDDDDDDDNDDDGNDEDYDLYMKFCCRAHLKSTSPLNQHDYIIVT
jgi:hypothetical protein